MEIKQVWAAYWSPTGSTRKVAETIAGEIAAALNCPLHIRDFTLPAAREGGLSFAAGDLAVIATPTYAGKVPNKLLPYLQSQTVGSGALAVPVVTFGNRAYDNSLAELTDTLARNGLCPVAAGAFVCRHAFTDELAWGRPGILDTAEMRSFAGRVADKVKGLTELPPPVQVPGSADAPYYVPKGIDGEPAKFLKAKPKTDLAKCCNCGVCARSCPMGAINPANVAEVPGTCIKCQACVRKCTHHAKFFDDPAFLSHVAMLEQNFTEPKENAVFL
jgi:ferredoxin